MASKKYNFVGSGSIHPGSFIARKVEHLRPDKCFDSHVSLFIQSAQLSIFYFQRRITHG